MSTNLDLTKFPKDVLVRGYLALRERKKALAKETAEIEVKLERLEGAFLRKMEIEGEEGFRAAGQTVYRSVIKRVKVEDREMFFGYVVENNATGLLEARASKDGLLSWQELHPGDVPGLIVTEHMNINVRKGA
jgi:hypothetical protein